MKANDFNRIAGAYDLLAGIIFGKALKRAQQAFLSEIKPNSKVLILGGGTGWVLQELEKLSIPLSVVYIEASSKMLTTSKNRGSCNTIRVDFIKGTEKDIPDEEFDAVITYFFLDVFNFQNLPGVMQQVQVHLSNNGLWLCADFKKNNILWQQALLRCMHWFFRITANLESRSLKSFDPYFRTIGLKKQRSKLFFNAMIESALYKKM